MRKQSREPRMGHLDDSGGDSGAGDAEDSVDDLEGGQGLHPHDNGAVGLPERRGRDA